MNYLKFNELYLEYASEVAALTAPFPDSNYPKEVVKQLLLVKQQFGLNCYHLEYPEAELDTFSIADVNEIIAHYEGLLVTQPKKKNILFK